MSNLYAKGNTLVSYMEKTESIPEDHFAPTVAALFELIYQLVESYEVSDLLSRLLDIAIRLHDRGDISDAYFGKLQREIDVCKTKMTIEGSKNAEEVNLLLRFSSEMTSTMYDASSFTFTRRPSAILNTIIFVKFFLTTMRGKPYKDMLMEQTGNAYIAKLAEASTENTNLLEQYLGIGKELGFYTEDTKEQYLESCKQHIPELYHMYEDKTTDIFTQLNM